MKTTILSEKEFNKLKPYELSNQIFNTEAKLYILKEKEQWNYVYKLLKRFYIDRGPTFGNKLLTINSLIDNKDVINMPELVIPESIAIVNNEVVGYVMPLIDSANLYEVLNQYNVSNKDKINYLKQIGVILERMKQIRRHTNISSFYLNDLHENNFILDLDTNSIKVVDMDSCKINDNKVFGSRYLSCTSPIINIPKYEKVNDGICGGFFEPNEDSEIYCYIVIILNFLSNMKINRMSIEEVYNFLNYLCDIGVEKELIDIFSNIYETGHNINPYELLDSLVPYIGQCRAYSKIKKYN